MHDGSHQICFLPGFFSFFSLKEGLNSAREAQRMQTEGLLPEKSFQLLERSPLSNPKPRLAANQVTILPDIISEAVFPKNVFRLAYQILILQEHFPGKYCWAEDL